MTSLITQAESNDIHVVNRSDLLGITEAIGISDDPLVRAEIKAYQPARDERLEEETGMEIDEDLVCTSL